MDLRPSPRKRPPSGCVGELPSPPVRMLFAFRAVPSFTTSMRVSLKRAAVCTKSAAGRACRPTLFVIVNGRSGIDALLPCVG